MTTVTIEAKKILLLLALIVVSTVGALFLLPGTADALDPHSIGLTENTAHPEGDNNVYPPYVHSDIEQCDSGANHAAKRYNMFANWISPANARGVGRIVRSVETGSAVASESLQFNQLVVNCFDFSSTEHVYVTWMTNQIYNISVSGTNKGSVSLSSGNQEVNITNATNKGGNGQRNVGFTYTLSNPFSAAGTYIHHIELAFYTIYDRSNGTFACAEGTEITGGALPKDVCTPWYALFDIEYRVTDPPPTASCSRVGSGTVFTGQEVTFNASSTHASGNYEWGGGLPGGEASGANNSTYKASWDTANSAHWVRVRRSGSAWSYCYVNVIELTVECARSGTGTVYTGQAVTFTRTGGTATGHRSWSGGGDPATRGNYDSFETTFNTYGDKTITIKQYASGSSGLQATGTCTVSVRAVVDCEVTSSAPHYVGAGITFGLTSNSTATGNISWSGGGSPSTGTASTFTTEFNSPGTKTITIRRYESGSSGTRPSGTCTVTLTYAPPAVTCSLTAPASIETTTTGEVRVRIGYSTPGNGPPSIVIGIVRVREGGVTTWQPVPPEETLNRGANGRDFINPNYQFNNAGAAVALDGFARIRYNNGLGTWLTIDIENCDRNVVVGDTPYLREYGGDVWSGGVFEHTGGEPRGGGIYAFNDNSTADGDPADWAGAGAQLTVTALLNIREYASAGNRTGCPGSNRACAPKGLSFANTMGGDYGGAFGYDRTIHDYYNETRDAGISSDISAATTNLRTTLASYTGSEPRQLVALANNPVITGGNITIHAGEKVAIYARGDVYIGTNITLRDPGNTDTDSIPYFALIVCGRIHIGENVTRLDGLYVAQPGTVNGGNCVSTGGTSGTIYTCSYLNGTTPTRRAAADLEDDCGSQLSINGSVVASRIKWLRTYCSLRYAAPGESINFSTGAGSTTCANSGNSRAAEIVNYTPHMWLADSPLKVPGRGGQDGLYSAIRGLPPIFNTGSGPSGGGVTPPDDDDDDDDDEELPGGCVKGVLWETRNGEECLLYRHRSYSGCLWDSQGEGRHDIVWYDDGPNGAACYQVYPYLQQAEIGDSIGIPATPR